MTCHWRLAWCIIPPFSKDQSHMLEIGLITARIKDMQGRSEALRGYL